MATNCSIWDPNPMCLGSEQSAQSEDELANYRKRTASEKADDIFIKEKKCANWEPYTIHPSNPQAIAEGKGISHAEHHVPRYSGPGTKFRFLIISAGPPGSGKTAVVNHIKKDLAMRINKSAATGGIDNPNSAWENLGHDQNIKMDPEFQNKYKEIEYKAKSENNGDKILSDNSNISEYALKIKDLYQTTKSGTDGEKRESKEDKAIQLASQDQLEIFSIQKSFMHTVRDIWTLQYRLDQRHKANQWMHRLKFRAAYDFLLLRADTCNPELADLANWWTQYQECDETEQAALLSQLPQPKKRKRRPRKKKTAN